MNVSKASFKKLPLKKRYDCLKEDGRHIASRVYGSYNVYLFQFGDFYVEMWKKLGVNLIHSIDVVSTDETLNTYIDPKKINELIKQ